MLTLTQVYSWTTFSTFEVEKHVELRSQKKKIPESNTRRGKIRLGCGGRIRVCSSERGKMEEN